MTASRPISRPTRVTPPTSPRTTAQLPRRATRKVLRPVAAMPPAATTAPVAAISPPRSPTAPAAGPGSPSHAGDGQSQSQAADSPVDVDAAHDAAVDAENASSFGTFWLHRTLPDPTPPARRLEPRFARNLVSVSRSQHVDWALVLGVVRAQGHRTSVPATKAKLRSLASNLRRLHASQNAWQAVLALEGRTGFADRAIALRNYNRAVGLRTLVRGLVASKGALQDRVLSDRRIDIYAGGRSDIAAGRDRRPHPRAPSLPRGGARPGDGLVPDHAATGCTPARVSSRPTSTVRPWTSPHSAACRSTATSSPAA